MSDFYYPGTSVLYTRAELETTYEINLSEETYIEVQFIFRLARRKIGLNDIYTLTTFCPFQPFLIHLANITKKGCSPYYRFLRKKINLDYLTIGGGDLESLTNAFRLDYYDRTDGRPLDVCVVAGYNDLIKVYCREYILYKLKKLATTVLQAIPGPNTVAISTFLYPPQLSWFADNGPVPYPGYINHRENIDWLNNEIHVLNTSNNVPLYAGFHTYGVKKATRNHTNQYGQVYQRVIKAHRWEHRRETEPLRMLHLRDNRRFKMGTGLNKYFIVNTVCENSPATSIFNLAVMP